MEKQTTIAGTMKAFMATGPSTDKFPTYKSLNDYVGKLHGKDEGACQALAGEKAWEWYADTTAGVWRKATEAEIAAKRLAAAGKAHGPRKAKVMTAEERAALDAQVIALQAVNNPALAPLLTDLKARQTADDAARKGTLKDRLQAAVDTLGLAKAVEILEARVTVTTAEDREDEDNDEE